MLRLTLYFRDSRNFVYRYGDCIVNFCLYNNHFNSFNWNFFKYWNRKIYLVEVNLLHLYANGNFADESYDFWNICVICEIEFIFFRFELLLKCSFGCCMQGCSQRASPLRINWIHWINSSGPIFSKISVKASSSMMNLNLFFWFFP